MLYQNKCHRELPGTMENMGYIIVLEVVSSTSLNILWQQWKSARIPLTSPQCQGQVKQMINSFLFANIIQWIQGGGMAQMVEHSPGVRYRVASLIPQYALRQ